MTMAAAEAGAGRAAAARPAGSTATRRTESVSENRTRIFGQASARQSRPTAAARPRAGSTSRQPARSGQSRSSRRSQSRSLRLPVTSPEFHNYQGIILAEFVAAELLVAATPIAVRKNQPGLSPYVPRDMTKLLAIGLVFFLLELTAVVGRGAGRFGAWFGALILLVVGMNEAANVAKVLDIFGGGTSKGGTSTSGDGAIEGTVGPVLQNPDLSTKQHQAGA